MRSHELMLRALRLLHALRSYEKLLHVIASAASMVWLGYAVVDSWLEAVALAPAMALIVWLMFRVWSLLDERAYLADMHEKFAEQHRETLAQLEYAQLRVDALGLMGIRVVWMSARELEELVKRVKAGQKASPLLGRWTNVRRRLAFLPLRGLNEETARVWPLDAAEAKRVSRGVPRLEAVVSLRAKDQFAPELTEDELSRPRA